MDDYRTFWAKNPNLNINGITTFFRDFDCLDCTGNITNI
jgi:hypothetical protein